MARRHHGFGAVENEHSTHDVVHCKPDTSRSYSLWSLRSIILLSTFESRRTMGSITTEFCLLSMSMFYGGDENDLVERVKDLSASELSLEDLLRSAPPSKLANHHSNR